MENPKFGPGDMSFRDFSKPWYNDRAEALCINAIESLLGKNLTEFSFNGKGVDPSRRCVEIGAEFEISLLYCVDSGLAGIELQKLIDALEAQGYFSHSQLEDRYNALLKSRPHK